jgi:serine/threonine protein kinase
LILELCALGSLDALLADSSRKLNWASPLHGWALDVAKGVEYLHTRFAEPIVHRDIKSANVLVTQLMVCKLGDMGETRSVANGETMTQVCGRECRS